MRITAAGLKRSGIRQNSESRGSEFWRIPLREDGYRNRLRITAAGLILSFAFLLGCGAAPAPTASGPPVPKVPGIPTAAPPPAPVPAPVPMPATETVVAEVGVGQKGRSLDEYEGVVVTPVKSLFAARERLTFEVSIPQALNLFNATEGRMPKSHEEFMEKIIAANQIGLPELPMGHRYKWDPQLNELMVERPKLKSEPATP